MTDNFGGFWRRVAAYLIDSIILVIATVPIGWMFGVDIMEGLNSTELLDESAPANGLDLIANLVSLVIGWLYFALSESSSWQATPGKKALGMFVTDEAGNRIGFGRATGRYFGKIVSAVILLIGFIMVAFTARKQGLHDLMASTLVFKGRPGDGAHAGVFD